MLIETSDEKDWFDAGLLNSMYGQTQYCLQAMKWTSDWNGEDVSKRVVSSMVIDICPYLSKKQKQNIVSCSTCTTIIISGCQGDYPESEEDLRSLASD